MGVNKIANGIKNKLNKLKQNVKRESYWKDKKIYHKYKDRTGVVIYDEGGATVTIKWDDGTKEKGVMKENLKKIRKELC